MTTDAKQIQDAFDDDLWAYIAEIFSGNDWALLWFKQLQNVVGFWDKIADCDVDKVDAQQLNDFFEILLIHWVYNPFYQQNKIVLTPVIVNSISAWKASNGVNPKFKAYDITTEVACTMCMIIGGIPMINKHMPKLREMCWRACQLDDVTDNGKR